MSRRALVATTVVLLTAACARQPTPTTVSPSPTGTMAPTLASHTVVLERTGGFAGQHETVTVNPTGAWHRSSRTGKRVSGQLTTAQQRELNALAADARLPDEARRTPGPTRCHDAFTYRITIDSTTISYVDCPTDTALPAAAMAIVVLVESATRR